MQKPTRSRKLLIASVGVATINYVAACGGRAIDTGEADSSGSAANGQGGKPGVGPGGAPTSGNLVAPPATGSGGQAAIGAVGAKGGSTGVRGSTGEYRGGATGSSGSTGGFRGSA